ncbi:hypothetical protein JCGZ_03241 [Jatropha curcas]|uniref:Proline-rich protein PRCC n=1 Tax=Jatropha curcas TaxID=180498 RepID=A0A067KY22_JATCU|nr:uncharacterized protein LOC105631086 [Jatropha curcas]KDP41111.1 hypothetical protein JCGZ_03241 [Jatropha curcas]
MDSLLANYASSDEEEENQHQNSISYPKITSSASHFSSLPQPKSSLLFSAIPQPQHQLSTCVVHHDNHGNNKNIEEDEDDPKRSSKSSSLFSFLPQPKTQAPQQPISSVSSLDPTPKRVVQFKPPINLTYVKPSDLDDEDDEDEGEMEKKWRKESEALPQSSSVKSFLSSIPAPKNSSTLGVLPSATGSGRRSIVETKTPTSSSGSFGAENDQTMGNYGSYDGTSLSYESGPDKNGGSNLNYGSYESGISQDIGQKVNAGDDGSSYGSYENYTSYGTYNDYQQFGNTWSDELAAAVPERTGPSESALRVPGKRGRKDIVTEVIEVKQDELTKNRPREDQVKLTGIAFGPSYEPTSTKGKPSKLHKRKHQIGSLYFDMKQKEMELTERRAKGFLTKAQTQAKYGW